MPSGPKKRKNAKKKKETALHMSDPTNIPEEVDYDEVKVALEKEGGDGVFDHDDDGDDEDASPRSWNSKQTSADSSSSTIEEHPRLLSPDSVGKAAETVEVSKMDEQSEGLNEAAVVTQGLEEKDDAIRGVDALDDGKINVEMVDSLKVVEQNDGNNSSSSSSSDDGGSDSDRDNESEKQESLAGALKETEKPEVFSGALEELEKPEVFSGALEESENLEITSGAPEIAEDADRIGAVKVEVPIESTGMERIVGVNKEETVDHVAVSDLASSVESVKGETAKSIDNSGVVTSSESARDEITDTLTLSSSTEVHQEVERQVVVVDTAEPIAEPSKDNEKSETTETERTLPPPIVQRTSWKSCCGVFDVFLGSNR